MKYWHGICIAFFSILFATGLMLESPNLTYEVKTITYVPLEQANETYLISHKIPDVEYPTNRIKYQIGKIGEL